MSEVFYCYSLADKVNARAIQLVLQEEGINFDLLNESVVADSHESLFVHIEKSNFMVVLASDNSRDDSVVKDCVKYANDLNKTIIPIGYRDKGLFKGQSWIKKEWSIREDEYAFCDDDTRAELICRLKELLGMTFEPGDRVGRLMYLFVNAECRLKVKGLYSVVKPGEFLKVRLFKGNHNVVVESVKYKGLSGNVEIKVESNVGSEKFIITNEKMDSDYYNSCQNNERKRLADVSLIEGEIANLEKKVYNTRCAIENLKTAKAPRSTDLEAGDYVGVVIAVVIGVFIGGIGAIILGFIAYSCTKSSKESQEKKRVAELDKQISKEQDAISSINNELNENRKKLNKLNSISYLPVLLES